MAIEDRTGAWRRLRARHPRTVWLLLLLIVLSVVADGILLSRFVRYRAETERLRAGMTEGERQRADLVVATERHRLRVEIELIRREARGDRRLHLAVNVDSGFMVLERDGVPLRTVPVRLGLERIAGPVGGDSTIEVPLLGQRTVERVLTNRDSWEVPESVFRDRGMETPDDRNVPGALGERAIVLGGGTIIYAIPDSGPLADSAYVLQGAVQVPVADLKTLAPNIRPGMTVYFYR